jgi:transposase
LSVTVSDRCDEEAYEQARRQWVKQTWPAILQRAKAMKAVILFTDEVSFALWGSMGRTWTARGQQPKVKTTGQRKGLKMFGAIDFHSGAFYYREAHSYKLTAQAVKQLRVQGLTAEQATRLQVLKGVCYSTQTQFLDALRQTLGEALVEPEQTALLKAAEDNGKFNTDSYIEFLTQLLEQIETPIILIEDNVSYHRSRSVEQFQAQYAQRLYRERLPTFSPDFNPIEKLWKNTKRDATHLKYFRSFNELRASVLTAFRHYLNDAAKVIGVMKKLRAQAGLA